MQWGAAAFHHGKAKYHPVLASAKAKGAPADARAQKVICIAPLLSSLLLGAEDSEESIDPNSYATSTPLPLFLVDLNCRKSGSASTQVPI